jgi:hypothetical protein
LAGLVFVPPGGQQPIHLRERWLRHASWPSVCTGAGNSHFRRCLSPSVARLACGQSQVLFRFWSVITMREDHGFHSAGAQFALSALYPAGPIRYSLPTNQASSRACASSSHSATLRVSCSLERLSRFVWRWVSPGLTNFCNAVCAWSKTASRREISSSSS